MHKCSIIISTSCQQPFLLHLGCTSQNIYPLKSKTQARFDILKFKNYHVEIYISIIPDTFQHFF